MKRKDMKILCRKSPSILLFTLANALQIQVCPFKGYYPIPLDFFFLIFTAIYINRYESNNKNHSELPPIPLFTTLEQSVTEGKWSKAAAE